MDQARGGTGPPPAHGNTAGSPDSRERGQTESNMTLEWSIPGVREASGSRQGEGRKNDRVDGALFHKSLGHIWLWPVRTSSRLGDWPGGPVMRIRSTGRSSVTLALASTATTIPPSEVATSAEDRRKPSPESATSRILLSPPAPLRCPGRRRSVPIRCCGAMAITPTRQLMYGNGRTRRQGFTSPTMRSDSPRGPDSADGDPDPGRNAERADRSGPPPAVYSLVTTSALAVWQLPCPPPSAISPL